MTVDKSRGQACTLQIGCYGCQSSIKLGDSVTDIDDLAGAYQQLFHTQGFGCVNLCIANQFEHGEPFVMRRVRAAIVVYARVKFFL